MPLKLPSFRSRKEPYPADLWTQCPQCEEMLFNKQLEKSLRVCGSCGHHFRFGARPRLASLMDAGSFVERDAGLVSVDPLGFVDQKAYPDRIAAAQQATGLRDAAVWGTGTIAGIRVAICALDFGFMGGSMGSVVGEKVARAAEAALGERMPLIVVSASGGARMQEGTLALMQLAKTLAAIERLGIAGVPYISVLTDPTTGGVFASYAAVGDVNVAEPNALIGFAGARVSAGTIAEELPPGFQRSEFLLKHGFLDRIVTRADLRDELATILGLLRPRPPRPVAVGRTEAGDEDGAGYAEDGDGPAVPVHVLGQVCGPERRHLGEHVPHQLEFRDGPAELTPFLRVFDRSLQTGLGDPDTGICPQDPLQIQGLEHGLEPPALLAQDLVAIHPHVIHEHLTRWGTAHAELSERFPRGEPLHPALQDEERGPPDPAGALIAGHDDEVLCDRGVGDERLGAVDQEVVTVPVVMGSDGEGIGAGLGLGQTPASQRLPGDHRGDVAPLLLLRAIFGDEVAKVVPIIDKN